MFEKILRRAFPEIINGKKILGGGLLKDKVDLRDFQYGWLWGGDYAPKREEWKIPTVSLKDQNPFNTCVFNSCSIQKEVDEGCELSVSSLVARAKLEGLVSQDGFSTLRSGQKMIQNYGISSIKTLGERSQTWENYSHASNLTPEIAEDAKLHRSESYWQVSGKSQTLKALDEGRVIHTGIDWYSGYNMSSGFTAPWIIKGELGFKVGGHAIAIVGYKRGLYIIQNSYGPTWGDGGCFYITMDFFDRVGHARYIQKDMPVDIVPLIRDNDGKAVKVKGKPEIYLIKEGKKCPFLNMLVFYSFGFAQKGYVYVDSVLDKVETGETLDFKDSPYWAELSTVSDLTNAILIINAIEKYE